MNNFIKNVIGGNGINPPESCIMAFNENFTGAINVDWFEKESHYEAIFYKDNIEYIAIFNKSGQLEEYKMFLPNNYLPETIKADLENKGEIMNIVLINKGNCINYEVIIRDQELNRHLFLITDLGKILTEKIL